MKATFQSILLPFLALGLLLSTGCSIANKSTPSKFYVLTALPQNTEPLQEFDEITPNVGVTQVEIPAFLDRPQITYRVNSNEVNYDEFARWAEPMGDGVTRVVRQNLTELMGSGKVTAFPWMQPFPRQMTFSAVLTDFSAGENGKAVMSVIYRIADSKNQTTYLVREASFVHSTGGALTTTNAVAALSDTLAQFSKAAAADIAKVDREIRASSNTANP